MFIITSMAHISVPELFINYFSQYSTKQSRSGSRKTEMKEDNRCEVLFRTKSLVCFSSMAENDVENELLDYEEDEEPQAAPETTAASGKKEVKGSYVSIHSSGFRDFLLKPELLRAIVDCGFEHPSEGMIDLPQICLRLLS